ncbi:ATP-dependent DNA/RNA helicase [Schaereria dolodes]|nr:ATP-dependent DNA/RNA helicase [Schaereria dolodes]
MKRKLNEEDVPTPSPTPNVEHTTPAFVSLGLDSRLLQAVAKKGFTTPTPVQSKVIPLALEGKAILARAKTGSGKTAAYVLPILEAILRRKRETPKLKAVSALILVPTRELAEQVTKAFAAFSVFCAKEIRPINLTKKTSDDVQRFLLADSPDIVVATPACAAVNLSTSILSLEHLTHLVIDEADLVLSYGYDDDLQNVAKAIPQGLQTFLMSATLTSEVDKLKGIFCRDPVILKLDDEVNAGGSLSQYVVKCAEDEKFLLIYVIFKLKLVKGKSIVFVGDIDRCYRLKLFLEQFGIKSCVLNSELPVNSRIHVVEEFNKNVYDIIIATDEHEILGSEDLYKPKTDTVSDPERKTQSAEIGHDSATIETVDNAEDQVEGQDEEKLVTASRKKRRKTPKKDKEYGISRGIDFQNVACVLNFDLPITSKSYTHRIGRTARAGKSGMALSFVIPAELYRKHKPTSFPTTQHDEEVFAKISAYQRRKTGREIEPYQFDMKKLDAFRYRMSDALRAVTSVAIREARTRELRQELLKSEKLKRHFEENPDDLRHLRHDGELRAARIQPHLKHVPDYLLPREGKRGLVGGELGFVGLRRNSENRVRRVRMEKKMRGKGGKAGIGVRKRVDPLKTFSAKGRRS